MNMVIGWLVKLSGFGWVWNKIDGSKTYLGGGALLLSGAAQVLQSIISVKDLPGFIEFLKHLPQDQGILAVAAGLAAIGLGHKANKLSQDPEIK